MWFSFLCSFSFLILGAVHHLNKLSSFWDPPYFSGLPGKALVTASGENWLGDWERRTKLTINYSGKIDTSLTNFPILVYLGYNSSGINSQDMTRVFDELQSDANRKKIAVTTSDGSTQCKVEIEKWDDTNEQACLWVKVPTVSSSANTDLYLYYDSSKADNTTYVGDPGSAPAQDVWSNGFVAVYHMNDGADTSHISDSTSGQHTGTKVGANEPYEITSGQIGEAQSFDGVNDYISIPDHDDFSYVTTDALTVSFWRSLSTLKNTCTFANNNGYIRYFGKSDSGQSEWGFVQYNNDYYAYPNNPYHDDEDTDNRVLRTGWYTWSLAGGQGAGDYFQPGLHDGSNPNPAPDISVDQWIYITGKMSSDGYISVYRDGEIYHYPVYWPTYLTGQDPPNQYVTPGNGTAPVKIGTRDSVSTSGILYGRMDEIRISNVFRSEAWETASYYSGNDDLLTFGPEELY
ncbi:MAG: DUF2341 domain-containing protein, partial [Petrimonas sp.]|nr:DUF2341 domain-containing protein [Petrimonas sp.]